MSEEGILFFKINITPHQNDTVKTEKQTIKQTNQNKTKTQTKTGWNTKTSWRSDKAQKNVFKEQFQPFQRTIMKHKPFQSMLQYDAKYH